jgi:signal transduction histidine kinase
VAAARIRVDDREFSTPGFDDAVHRMQAPIYIDNQERGRVEVAYVEERAAIDHGPFLEEEQSLIEAVAREVGRIWGQQQAELERQRLQEQLRHADRLATIGQLAAGVAHELNEPLGSILGFAQLGRKTPDLPAQLDRDLERIEGAALHSREVVRKLNLFARQTPTRQEGFDLTRAVRDGMFLLESRCRKEGIDLQLELADDLGVVRGDSGQITQVLMNLVVNALQAMEDGGILHIATFREEDQACLQVADTGGGIPAEVCARIFEPFFTTKDVGEGTGLGLSVVHGIVSAHGGRIEVQSDTGRGTTFTVRLPIREDAGPSGAPAPDSG